MKSIDCMLKLVEDSDFSNTNRVVEMSIDSEGDSRRGVWKVIRDATDPRMRIGEGSGRWVIYPTEEHGWVMYFVGSTYLVLLELYKVGDNPLGTVSCGTSRGGNGWHQGPPSSNVQYVLSFGCV